MGRGGIAGMSRRRFRKLDIFLIIIIYDICIYASSYSLETCNANNTILTRELELTVLTLADIQQKTLKTFLLLSLFIFSLKKCIQYILLSL